jgi:Ca-activated chloride channel family protein
MRRLTFGSTLLSTFLAVACSAGSDGAAGEGLGGLTPGVGQGGAQDFGRFREILLDGGIPGPRTIDDVGFFAEHKIDLPSAGCGESVCVHGSLGVMGNMITGSNCTVVLIGMNTPIDPAELERPPLNLVVAVDASGSMAGPPIEAVRDGLSALVAALEPEDRVALVTFSDVATLAVASSPGDAPELAQAIAGLRAAGGTNIFDGLRTAYEEVDAHADPSRQNRVILLSDGEATQGIESPAKIVGMSAAWAELGYGLTTIGMGDGFDIDLMRELSEVGGGAFYYLDGPGAVQEVFVEEVEAFLVPLAEDVRIDLDVTDGWRLRRIYGTTQAVVGGNEAGIDIPSLQIAHRLDGDDHEQGRRGGGGAIVAELLPTGIDTGGAVGRIGLTYRDVATQELVAQEVDIASPLAPWETPSTGWFTDAAVEKSFVMLNIYVGFQMAATRASYGDDTSALATLLALRESVAGWLAEHDDFDITDDLAYVDLFIENLRARGGGSIDEPDEAPPEPWPAD